MSKENLSTDELRVKQSFDKLLNSMEFTSIAERLDFENTAQSREDKGFFEAFTEFFRKRWIPVAAGAAVCAAVLTLVISGAINGRNNNWAVDPSVLNSGVSDDLSQTENQVSDTGSTSCSPETPAESLDSSELSENGIDSKPGDIASSQQGFSAEQSGSQTADTPASSSENENSVVVKPGVNAIYTSDTVDGLVSWLIANNSIYNNPSSENSSDITAYPSTSVVSPPAPGGNQYSPPPEEEDPFASSIVDNILLVPVVPDNWQLVSASINKTETGYIYLMPDGKRVLLRCSNVHGLTENEISCDGSVNVNSRQYYIYDYGIKWSTYRRVRQIWRLSSCDADGNVLCDGTFTTENAAGYVSQIGYTFIMLH